MSYSGPMPPANSKPTFHQQAAKASLVAPIIAVALDFFTNQAGRQPAGGADRWSGLVVGIIAFCLILAGFVLGIIALFGIRTQGKQKILVPAIVGISLNGFFVALGAVAFLVAVHLSHGLKAASSQTARAPVTAQEVSDSITKSPGWVGKSTRDGVVVVVISVPPGTPLSAEIKDAFGGDHLCMSVAVSNAQGSEPVTVNAADLSVVMKDGTIHAALSPEEMFAAAPLNGPQLRSAYPSTATVAAGAAKEASVAAFLPPEVDPSQIDHAIVLLDGKPLTIPGRFLSVEEKAANLAKAHR